MVLCVLGFGSRIWFLQHPRMRLIAAVFDLLESGMLCVAPVLTYSLHCLGLTLLHAIMRADRLTHVDKHTHTLVRVWTYTHTHIRHSCMRKALPEASICSSCHVSDRYQVAVAWCVMFASVDVA